MDPEPKDSGTGREALLNATPAKKDEKAGPGMLLLCGVVILAFIGWIAWLALGGGEESKTPKKLSAEEYRQAVSNASQADPELNAMLALKKNGRKAAVPSAKIDVNSASPEQLKKISCLSEWDVNAIVKLRPFKSLDELVSKKALGASRFSEVQNCLAASQPPN